MKLANLQDYFLGSIHEYFEMVVYSIFSFLVPFFIGHPQIAVGIIVNAMLIVSALNLKGHKLLPVIVLPSIAMLSRGMLFGPFTIYLLYLTPFIWIGNSIIVFSFKFLKLRLKKNYWLALIIGAILKSGFLFLAAFALYSLGIIPAVFLAAMGVMQLVTALLGGTAAYAVHAAKKHLG